MRNLLLALVSITLATPASAATVTFTSAMRYTTAAEIASDPALAGQIVTNWFLSSSGDILSINKVTITIKGSTNGSRLYQHSAGSDVEPPHPLFVGVIPALGADSWISTSGDTGSAGGGFSMHSSSWFDIDSNGPQTNFNFARLTTPLTSNGISFNFNVSIPSDNGQVVASFPFSGLAFFEPSEISPEPSSGLLSAVGLVGLLAIRRRGS